MRIKSFLAELRRRHVFRVAAWYAVAAWLVIQIAVNVFPHLLLPDWSVRLVVALCLIGFPIALALAWALEVTPEGLKVADEYVRPASHTSTPPWRGTSLWLALAGGVLLGVGAVHAWRAFAPTTADPSSQRDTAAPQAPVPVPARVLAVLPFENLGGDANNAAFTAGIHDSLITRIAKIGGMTVISRTSVMAYEGARPNLKDVAKALNVTHVVEGSVQREGDRVRIQAQLIDAGTDSHLWAETYDRTLTDGFSIQSEIATAVAHQLSVRLNDRERTALQSIPTQNPKAFEQYVLGHAELIGTGIFVTGLTEAGKHFETAVEFDPKFALAFAELSIMNSLHAFVSPGLLEEQFEIRISKARASYAQALALQPDMPEAILARGVYQYLVMADFAAAESDLVSATELLPNDYLAKAYLGSMRRRQGLWDEAAKILERALVIEPAGQLAIWNLSQTYRALRNPKAMEMALLRARAANPTDPWIPYFQALQLLHFQGDIRGHVAALEPILSQHPDNDRVVLALANAYHALGRFGDAARVLESFPDDILGGPGAREGQIGWVYLRAGDPATANLWFERSLALMDTMGAHLTRSWIFSAESDTIRAFTLAGLSRKNEAAAALRDALQRAPRDKDEIEWAFSAFIGAMLLAQMGDIQGALELIRQLLHPPSTVTPYQIWFDWAAAPLRANPEFRELMARHGVDVTRDPRAEVASQ